MAQRSGSTAEPSEIDGEALLLPIAVAHRLGAVAAAQLEGLDLAPLYARGEELPQGLRRVARRRAARRGPESLREVAELLGALRGRPTRQNLRAAATRSRENKAGTRADAARRA